MQNENDKNVAILKYLLKHKGEVVSGEDLAFNLGISRVALNKRIKKMIEKGIPVQPIERKGYFLDKEPEVLSPEVIKAYLENPLIGQDLHVYEVVDSTNRIAKDLAFEGAPEGCTIVADYQTAGKGRLGRKWFSLRGKTFIFLLYCVPG